MREKNIITINQLNTAIRIGEFFGHFWTQFRRPVEPDNNNPKIRLSHRDIPASTIISATDQQRGVPIILGPALDENNFIHFNDETSGFSWEITEDGDVRIQAQETINAHTNHLTIIIHQNSSTTHGSFACDEKGSDFSSPKVTLQFKPQSATNFTGYKLAVVQGLINLFVPNNDVNVEQIRAELAKLEFKFR